MRSHHAPHFLGLIGFASLCLASAFAIPAAVVPLDLPVPTTRALDGLVAGVALFPDSMLQTILVAAESPVALHHAATAQNDGGARAERPAGGRFASRIAERRPAAAASPAIEELRRNPEVLAALDQHLLVTARLGAAHRADPDAVWQAIARVRAQIERAATDDAQAEGTAATPLWVIAATISEDLASPDVVAEIDGVAIDADVSIYATTFPPPVVIGIAGGSQVVQQNVQVTVNQGTATTNTDTHSVDQSGGGGTTILVTGNGNATLTVGGGATTVQTPVGTVTAAGGAVGGTAQVGDTTYGGVAGAGTVTGPNGTTVNGGGYAKGSVTQTGDGSTWESSAGGAIASSSGEYAAGTREGSGSASKNGDGSVDFDRSSSGQVQSSQGNASFEHEGSATVTGDGNGSYEGSTTVKTDQGNVSAHTSAGDGKWSSSVDGPSGSSSHGSAKSGTPSTAPSTAPSTPGNAKMAVASPSSASNRGVGSRTQDSTGSPSSSRFGGTAAGATGATGASRFGEPAPSSVGSAGSRFPAATSPSPTSRAPKSSSLDFQGMSQNQIHQANQSLNQSWGSLEHKMKAAPSSAAGRSGSSSLGGSMSKQPAKPPKPSKPSSGGRGGRGGRGH